MKKAIVLAFVALSTLAQAAPVVVIPARPVIVPRAPVVAPRPATPAPKPAAPAPKAAPAKTTEGVTHTPSAPVIYPWWMFWHSNPANASCNSDTDKDCKKVDKKTK